VVYRLTEFTPNARYTADITHLADNGSATYFLSAGRLWGGWWTDTAGQITSIPAPATPVVPKPHIPGVADNLIVAHDENISGWIVGSFTVGLVSHGFLANERTGIVEQVDVRGAGSTFLTAINRSGELAGMFTDPAQRNHTFLADPQHVPNLGTMITDVLQVRVLVAAHG